MPADRARGRRRDGWLAAGVAVASFLVYLRTLFPGLTSILDSPKFQYLGRVLGTAHNPGYPLYVVVSWAFSYLPVGSVAYRINLLSAVAGALSVGALSLVLRRLGCSRPVAAIVALAFAFGNVYWSQAIRAEVYTLAALLLAAFVAVLFRWGERRQWADLVLAIGISALALGNHLTITLIAPAAVIYALATDRRQALRPATLLAGAALVAAGLAQYLFIIVRTQQHARYVESHAESVGQLWAVLHGAQFGSEFFAFGWGQILRLRVPLVARLAWAEFGIAGSLLLLAGLVFMWRRRAREAAFLALGLLAVAFFALTYDVSDTEVFLIPGFVLAWIVIGWMLERIVPDSGRARTVVLVAACLLLPGWQLVRNYRQNDAHAERFEIEFFQTLFAQLPERAAIVTEPAAIHWMLTYELEAEHAQRDRDVRLIAEDERTIRRLAQQGFQVFTFEGARGRLQDRGLLFVPLPLPRRPGSTIDLRARPVFRLSEVSRCAAVVSSGWTELTDVAKLTGGRLSLRVEEAPEGSAGLRLWGSRQLPACGRAAEDARLPACAPVVARTRGDDVTLCSPDDRRAVCAAPADAAPPAASAPSASLVTLAVGARSSALLDLPAGGDGLWARTTRGRVEMCPDPLLGREVLPNGSDVDSIDVGGGQDAYFGRGWLPVADQAGALRWAAAPGADIAIPLAAAGSPIRVVLSGSPPGPEAGGRVRIAVNGRLLDERGLRGGLSEYAWEVPAEAWRRGLNDLRVLLSGGPPAPQPAFGIERIRLFRLGSAPPPAGR